MYFMKIYIPTNWGWYVAIFIIVGPLLLLTLIEPNWVARFLGIGFFYFLPPLIATWYVVSPRKHLRDIDDRKNVWPEYIVKRIGDKGVDVATKILCLVAGAWWIIALCVPLVKDIHLVISREAPITTVGEVTHKKNTLFISEQIVFNNEAITKPENTFYAWYFPLRYIMVGNEYEYMYLPNSRLILDAKLISEE